MTAPVHAYAGKHRGTPRRCAACGRWETEVADWHPFCDVPGEPITTSVRGRHAAHTPTLEGP